MSEFVFLLGQTVLLRPYVFLFYAIFFCAALFDLGLKRTLLWTLLGYLLAFAAEYASIHWGIPFGDYYYIQSTRGRELWIAGVPFMDSLSFVYLSYISYRLALFFCCPLLVGKGGIFVVASRQEKRSLPVILLAGLLMALLDVVIDPVTLVGEQWFLGLIYGYPSPGAHFGIPFANYAGWFALGCAIVALFTALDGWLERRQIGDCGRRAVPFLHLLPAGLYFGVAGFILCVAFSIGQATLGWAGAYVQLPILALFLTQLFSEKNRATAEQVRRHNLDFPWAALPLAEGSPAAPAKGRPGF